MNKEEQIELFKFLINTLDYEFYSINGPKLMFNLGSLSNDTLWKLYYHTKLLKEDTDRKKIIEIAVNEYNNDIAKIDENISNMFEELSSTSSNTTENDYKPKIYNSKNVPSYQILMNEALGQTI
jgi:hypothetical protein